MTLSKKCILSVFVFLISSSAFSAEEICGPASVSFTGKIQIRTQSGKVSLDSTANARARLILNSQNEKKVNGKCICVEGDRNYESASVSNVKDAWVYSCFGS